MKQFFKMLMYSLCICIMTVGCESPIEEVEPTQYEVYVDMDLDQFTALGIDSHLQVLLLEYNDLNEIVDTNTWSGVKDGQSKIFTANKRSTKIVVKIELTASYGVATDELNLFLAQVFYLNPESKIRINVDGNARTSSYCPI